jgi:hypothetical protein
VALAPINSRGTLGELNMYVLKELGYDNSEIEKIDVSKGYSLLDNKRNKPILFIVTVGSNEFSGITLHRNLRNALSVNEKLLKSKNVWVPLMATGVGKMSFVDSYDTTYGILKNYANINFTIAIPDDNRGKEFINQFKGYNFHEKAFSSSDIEQIQNILNTEFTIALEKKINLKLGSHNHVFDLADISNLTFVELKFQESPNDRANIRKDINSLISRLSPISPNKKSRLIVVIHSVLSKNDKNFYDTNLRLLKNEKVIVYDKADIENLAIKHSTKNKGEKINPPITTPPPPGLDEENEPKFEQPQSSSSSSSKIAGLISDSDSGTDYLDISKDVNAFAKVMSAKSFSPPLAIALLGKWGSGKSFFMKKLMERIQTLSKSENQKAYCNGIAHVHFNAWSYMDSNLWASIITKIFEGLQKYITNDTSASTNKREIEKELTKKLNIAHEEIADLEHQKQSIDNKIETLESQKGKVEVTLQTKIDEIKSKSIKTVLNKLDESFNISAKITSALASNGSFNKSAEKFGEIVPREYWQNPTELYKKTKSFHTYLRTFFKGANWQISLVWFCLILIFVIFMKTIVFLVASILGVTDFSFSAKTWSIITLVGTFLYRNYTTFKHLQPLISTFWKVKEDYELQKKDVIFKINQAEKALKFEIENFKTEIQSINEQINQAKQSKLEIEYRLENTLTTEALFNFIKRRSDSDDYKKHLGIVSVIRKDFEILSELFSGHYYELISSGESEEFQKQFDKPLERIILYIDDLDRCSDDRVVQVLEAVNLLMAYPLFVVVVGVDPRWVKNALIKKHQLQFSNNGQQDENAEMIEPSSYLEKIFQVPFQLKSATNKSVKHMLKTLAESQPQIDVNEDMFSFTEDGELADHFDESDEIYNENIATQAPIIKEVSAIETVESLKFSDKEIGLLQSMSSILGTNPRALKRFVNIYRVIKAHEEFNYSNESEDGELLAVMFLIALPLGKYRKLVKSFEKYINNDLTEGNLEGFETSNTEKYVTEGTFNPGSDKFPLESLRVELLWVLQKNMNDTLLDQKKEIFRKHNPFIKRFTFNNL